MGTQFGFLWRCRVCGKEWRGTVEKQTDKADCPNCGCTAYYETQPQPERYPRL